MTHVFVTNDFPPKHGGIQSYLWELWRRLPPERFAVLTTEYSGAEEFDAAQPYRVVRAGKVLWPTPALVRRINALAREIDASVVVLDPALPLGLIGPHLSLPYAVVVHGAEVTVPRRLPGAAAALRRVLRGAGLVVAAGDYPAAETRRSAGDRTPPITVVPPGVDPERFQPLTADARAKARADLGLDPEQVAVLHLSRLVPRKGADVLLKAAGRLRASHPELQVLVAGAGRDRGRLERIAAKAGAPARFLGRVPDAEMPALYGAVDVFAHVCRNRWAGLEQEGFGIVFLEAAAAGVPQLAGASGGAGDAVADGETGVIVHRPDDVAAVADALAGLLADPERRARLGAAARARAAADFSYDGLAARLDAALVRFESEHR